MRRNVYTVVALIFAVCSVFIFNNVSYCKGDENVIKIKGAVKSEIMLGKEEISKLQSSVKRVKIFTNKAEYAGSFEMNGVSLADVLDQAKILKKGEDGFDRELDMYVVARGKDGKKAVFSYGEIFLGRGPDAIVVTKNAKQIFPHKHPDISKNGFDMKKWADAKDSKKLDFKSCASCHNGKELKPVCFPEGFCLFASGDVSGARFIENVIEIEVRQIWRKLGNVEKDKNNMWVESPSLNIFDRSVNVIAADDLKNIEKITYTSDTVGLGKGFHGKHTFEGCDIAKILKRASAGVDVSKIYVLVTAADGYRSLYSGSEVFDSIRGANLLLVDREEGAALKKGEGKYKAVIKDDFFVDRAVRSVSEIYCGIVE